MTTANGVGLVGGSGERSRLGTARTCAVRSSCRSNPTTKSMLGTSSWEVGATTIRRSTSGTSTGSRTTTSHCSCT
eukprot:2190141-Rhodomonas_salina.1